MAIYARCHRCGEEFQVRDESAGQTIPCPVCSGALRIPGEVNPYAAPTFQGPGHFLPVAKTPWTANASLVLGIMSLGCSILTGIPAMILGYFAKDAIRWSDGQLKGSGKATAGIVIGAIGLLFLPCVTGFQAWHAAREAAKRSWCMNNMKQIGLAMHAYQTAYGTFSPAYTTDHDGKPLLSWRVLLLPYLEQNDLYEEFELTEPWDSPANQTLLTRMPYVYRCPNCYSHPRRSDELTTYEVLVGPGTIFENGRATEITDINDGTSTTLLVTECPSHVAWTSPQDVTYKPGQHVSVGSHHPGGYNALFADGSVQFRETGGSPMSIDQIAVRNDSGQGAPPPP